MKQLYPVIAFALAATARADISVYNNEADFLADAPIVDTITFDDVPDMLVPVSVEIDSLRFVTRGNWQVPGFCSLERSIGASTIDRRNITFRAPGNISGSVMAVGFKVITFAIQPPADYAVAITTADGVVTKRPIADVVNATPAFKGFISTSPIVRVTLDAVGQSQTNFCLDDISRSEILPVVTSRPGGATDEVDELDDQLTTDE
jgi:hypothetical protein